jgi:primary-amine oxidase
MRHTFDPAALIVFVMQPHGFFNSSPAVDVPPSASDLDLKDNVVAAKPIQNGLLAKL